MPITTSAKKALRQNVRARAENIKRKKALQDIVKTFRKLLSEKKFEEAKKILPQIYKTIDKTAKARVIKPNKAARLKSRLSKKLTIA